MERHSLCGYSLIEIMMGILIVSIVMISAFYALTAANIGKIHLIQKGDIDREAFYFQESLVEAIKQAGIIDYEEYFNRVVVEDNSPQFHSGHYLDDTLLGNSSHPFYYCRSKNGTLMGTGGCVGDFNSTNSGVNPDTNYFGQTQLYGQYHLMAIDYNSDASSDLGDQNTDGKIVGDDDDEYLGDLPAVFSGTGRVYELYLISGDKKKRTFFRWNVKRDPDAPVSATCTGLGGNPSAITGSGCLGTLEMLKLEGVDWGNDHNSTIQDVTQFDGIIDTWIYDRGYYGVTSSLVASGLNNQYRIPLFSQDINVKAVDLFLFPNKDQKLAWKDTSASENISPFLKIHLILTPSYRKQRKVSGNPPEFTFSTTINLTSIFSNAN